MKSLALKIFVWVQNFIVTAGLYGLILLGCAVIMVTVKGFIRSIKRHLLKK